MIGVGYVVGYGDSYKIGAAYNSLKMAKGRRAHARIARVVVPGLAHHVTQRVNRREWVFFGAEDYQPYRRLIATAARRAGAEIWACCLMANMPV